MTEPEATATPRAIPPIHYPEDLPVAALRGEIAEALSAHQVIIVAGETGSGKTTQLPKICLELGRGREQRIGHTQPRRLAARNVARRIAEELATPLGALVGYQVRFQDSVGPETAVKLMTDGILLAELRRDRELRAYDTLIIDEAHERSLNIDFLLGYLHRLLPRRPDLKVVITSATIGVAIPAGAMQLTLTPKEPISAARFLVIPTTACFAAAYAWGPSPPITPAVLDILIMEPDPASFMWRLACFIP